MVIVPPIDKGHNFLCIVNKIVIQSHTRQNSVIRIFNSASGFFSPKRAYYITVT